LRTFPEDHPEIKERVRILGSSSRIPELLNALDIYVLSSLSEGISNSLLEAMATGLAVIVTQTGGNPEVVVEGQSGLLFRPGDSGRLTEHFRTLESQPGMRMDLGRNARQRVKESFSIESMVQRYAELYESVGVKALPGSERPSGSNLCVAFAGSTKRDKTASSISRR
jgi:glycosyltransferase involved in cell wall biosynthesis